jgi:hypothetical protein
LRWHSENLDNRKKYCQYLPSTHPYTTYNTKTHTIIHPYENTSTKLLILEEMVILLIVNLNIKCPKGSVIHVLSKFPFGSRKILIVSTFHSHFLQTFCSENSVWLDRQYCILGFKLLTSHIDKYWPCQQLSAPFKAGNSRQVQTCYIPQEYNTKETQHLIHSILLRRNRSSHDLEPQSIDVTMLVA